MSFLHRHVRIALVALSCLALGAGASAIAGVVMTTSVGCRRSAKARLDVASARGV